MQQLLFVKTQNFKCKRNWMHSYVCMYDLRKLLFAKVLVKFYVRSHISSYNMMVVHVRTYVYYT